MAIKKKPTFTEAEKRECLKRMKARLTGTGRFAQKFNALSEADQLKAAAKYLKKHGRRNKAGAVDWEQLFAFLEKLIALLMPLLFPT